MSVETTTREDKKQLADSEAGVYAFLDSIVNSLRVPLDYVPYLNQLTSSTGGGGGDAEREESARLEEEVRKETFHFMRGIMDECTHLGNFDVPVDPSLCLAIAAENDAYQPRDEERVPDITKVWKGSQLRFIPGEGHVSSYLFKQRLFREAIYEVLDKMEEKDKKL